MRIIRDSAVKLPESTTKTINAVCGVCLHSVLFDGSIYYDPIEAEANDEKVSLAPHPHKPGDAHVAALRAEARKFVYGKTPSRI